MLISKLMSNVYLKAAIGKTDVFKTSKIRLQVRF